MKFKFIYLCFCLCSLHMQSLKGESACLNPNFEDYSLNCYPSRLYVSYIEGKGRSYHTGYSSVGLFVAPNCNPGTDLQPFLDLRAHCFNDGTFASNVGMGLRFLNFNSPGVFGVNAYYDYRQIHHTTCNQIGVGLEYLSPYIDFRVNGYFPFGNRIIKISRSRFDYPGGFFYICGENTKTLAGFDAEMGGFLKEMNCCDCYSVYGAIGPYYYSKSFCQSTTFGIHGRLTARYGKYLRLEVRGYYDHIYSGIVQGLIAIEFPFGDRLDACHCGWNSCELTTQPTYREEMILKGKKHCFFETNF